MSGNRDVFFHIPSLQGGGAERVAVELAKHFVSKGWAPVFFVHAEGAAYQLPAGTEVIVASKTGHFGRLLELSALLKKRRPKAMMSFLPYANIISVLANLTQGNRVRLVVGEHTAFGPVRTADLKAKLKFSLARWLYPASHSIVAVSSGVAHDLRSALRWSARKKITVIHNPCYVPVGSMSPSSSERKGKTLLAVGRLVEQKGFDVLIRAFAAVQKRNSNVALVIAGEGPERARLEALVNELGLSGSVSLPGFTNDIGPLYRAADLFVCSSRVEGFGNVIVEALSYALPIVSTRCPHGPEEILQDGRFGRLVPVDDEVSLATAIVESLASSFDRRAALIERAQEFSLQSIGDRYLEQAGLNVPMEHAGEDNEVIA